MSLNTSKMSNHLDRSVIVFLVAAFIVSASFLTYRMTKYSPCRSLKINLKTKEFTEGKLIKFADNTKGATTWEWDFGDGSKNNTNKEALHVYKNAGEYMVSLLVNGICYDSQKLYVKKKPFIIDSSKIANFNLPSSIVVGKGLYVKDSTPNATAWEWRFGETAGVNSRKRSAKYTYESPGLKTVSLVVNGDVKHATHKKIQVLPLKKEVVKINQIVSVKRTVGKKIKTAPTTTALGQEEEKILKGPKTVPYISEKEFKNKLVLVSKKQLEVNDFKEYLCGDLNKSIVVNGQKTTFLEFCEKNKIKKFKIKEVKLYRDSNNCITNMTIKRSKYIL